MTKDWCILTNRMGVDIRSPSDGDLQFALRELWDSSDSEHPNALLRLGCSTGRMCVLEVYGSGTIIFSQWVDLDFEVELVPERRRANVSIVDALRLWRSLRQGDLSTIEGEGWEQRAVHAR